jgi:hypothetical protein
MPLGATLLVFKPRLLAGHPAHAILSTCAATGVFYLLANIARAEGKRVEPQLLADWGGWPSTILLRYHDPTIDVHTKARYHAALAAIAPDVPMPSRDQEEAAPAKADDAYRSATKRLLERRRAPRYRLLLDDNAAYGFRRNMLGLKPWAIGVLLSTEFIISLVWWKPLPSGTFTFIWLLRDLALRWKVYSLCVANLAVLIIWLFYVRRDWVRQAGFEYAERLLRTLED